MHDVLIVGAGPAGLTAAIYAQRAGLSSLLVESGPPGGEAALSPLLENVPGFPEGISGPDLAMKLVDQAQHHGAQLESDKITALRANGPADFTGVGELKEYPARSIIVASGTQFRRLKVPGEEEFIGRGVSFCATCDGMFYQGLTVAVIGGGNSAVTEALYLAKLVGKLYLVHRRDALRAEKALQDKLFALDNVEFVPDSVVKQIEGDDLVKGVVLENVKTGETSSLAVDGVFIYIGVDPHVEFLGDLVDYGPGRFVLTDSEMRTKTPGLFVAGDIRAKELRQIVTACADGAIAATSAYEYLAEYDPRFHKHPDRLRGEE